MVRFAVPTNPRLQESRRKGSARPAAVWLGVVLIAAGIAAGMWWKSQRPEECLRRGRAALKSGNRQSLLRESRKLLSSPGCEPQGRLLLGLWHARDGQPQEALSELHQAARGESTAVEAQTVMAEIFYSQGQYLAAIDAGLAAVARDPDALDARRWLAAAYYDVGATGEAMLELKKIAAGDPADPRPGRLLGLIHKDNERYTEAAVYFEESLRRDPDQQATLIEFAQTLVQLGRFDDALARLDECIPTPVTLTLQAACHIGRNETQTAHDLLRQALEVDPNHLSALLQLGSLLLAEGHLDDAGRALRDAVRLAPRRSQAHYLLSQVYVRQGKQEQAADELSRTHELQTLEREFSELHNSASKSPEDVQVRLRLGELAVELDKPDLARLWLRAALALAPDHPQARAALAKLNRTAPAP